MSLLKDLGSLSPSPSPNRSRISHASCVTAPTYSFTTVLQQ
uniref:Uncharacterized protein n=1 Tax=Arundo donax TaxID=35708 RepID=A0A0A8ZDR2_ARUDO